MLVVGILIIAVFVGALLWDLLGQPTKIRHLSRRRGSLGRSRKRHSGTVDKSTDGDVDDAA